MSEDKLEAGQIRIDVDGDKLEVLCIGKLQAFVRYLHGGEESIRYVDDLLEDSSIVKPERKEIEMSYHWLDSGSVFQLVKGSRDDAYYGNSYKRLELIDGKFYEVE